MTLHPATFDAWRLAYDAWRLAGPPDAPEVGTEDGDTCGRYEEPDEDAPRGYRANPCAGTMLADADGDMFCDWCGAQP
jgi:hypothetical protein